jgi:serine/tyrosine/threonine adenylyltransferase
MALSSSYQPNPIILKLGEKFYDAVKPAAFPKAIPRFLNGAWAQRVGLGELTADEWVQYFHRFEPLPENLKEPLALRYHGHQFQSYNDRLGDGRGFLYAQLKDDLGRTLDFGTKGSGPTPYSRAGDGMLTLKGAMREALATEMLESLGVNTSKTFCFFETGLHLQRNDEPSPTRAAVLTRLSHSHIRFGTFQRHAAHQDKEALKTLVSYVVRNFYPELQTETEEKWPNLLLREVTKRTASLCASWMLGGFVHGVLNTDNMSITGESFDYGPYRFLPKYDPNFTAAYFDETGLYAYGRQPEAVMWNLERLAECLLYLNGDREGIIESLKAFTPAFNDAAAYRFRDRLGLVQLSNDKDEELLLAGFNLMGDSQVTFEQFFFDWYAGEASETRAMASPEAKAYKGEHFERFRQAIKGWPSAPEAQARLSHPYFEWGSPEMLLIDEIEAIWKPIAESDDWSKFEKKIESIREMGRVFGRRK